MKKTFNDYLTNKKENKKKWFVVTDIRSELGPIINNHEKIYSLLSNYSHLSSFDSMSPLFTKLWKWFDFQPYNNKINTVDNNMNYINEAILNTYTLIFDRLIQHDKTDKLYMDIHKYILCVHTSLIPLFYT